jgi:hypothetical protein
MAGTPKYPTIKYQPKISPQTPSNTIEVSGNIWLIFRRRYFVSYARYLLVKYTPSNIGPLSRLPPAAALSSLLYCPGTGFLVGEQRTNGMLEILLNIDILPDAQNITGCNITKDRQVWFVEPTKQDQRVASCVQNGIEVPRVQNGIFPTDRRAPIKIVSGRAWSPGIYRSLRLLGKSLDVAWKRAFICPLTFN